MAFFAKSRRKLRTKNFEAHFHKKLRTLEKYSNLKKLRTTEPQPIFTGSYKKKSVFDREFNKINEDYLQNEGDLMNEDNLKMKTTSNCNLTNEEGFKNE